MTALSKAIEAMAKHQKESGHGINCIHNDAHLHMIKHHFRHKPDELEAFFYASWAMKGEG